MSKNNNPEEDYFTRVEREKKERLKQKLDAEAAEQALSDRKELHWNRCGKCGGQMHPKVFKGVEIDICEDCGAVLLDPGELEELAGADEGGVISTIGELFRFSRRK
ncbi:MAG: zf-TFIIB domain-containing protein [Alphaproteobacteria bacterium]|nr:zf-TFIIB domain-containing protein [Alphaproteobacteria bacterium]